MSCALVLLAVSANATPPSPYGDHDSQDIDALSPQDVSDYLSGKGMGLAKTAELNGHPGPTHVLELAAQLGLTPEQEIKTIVLSKKMQIRATPLRKQLVEEQHALDRLFASRAVNSESRG